MEYPALAELEDERHGIILAVHLGSRRGQQMDRRVAAQASVQLVGRREVGHPASHRMVFVDDLNGERAMRVMAAFLLVPDAPGQSHEVRPLLKGAAGKVEVDQPAALLDEADQVLLHLPFVLHGVIVLEVHEDNLIRENLVVGQETGIVDDAHLQACVLLQHVAQDRCRRLPIVPRIIDAGDQQHARRVGRRGRICREDRGGQSE
jgi:hypothetical protein